MCISYYFVFCIIYSSQGTLQIRNQGYGNTRYSSSCYPEYFCDKTNTNFVTPPPPFILHSSLNWIYSCCISLQNCNQAAKMKINNDPWLLITTLIYINLNKPGFFTHKKTTQLFHLVLKDEFKFDFLYNF